MTLRTATVAVLACIGVACAPARTARPQAEALSPFRLLPLREADAAWAETLAPAENRFGLNLLGITAADARHVFVYGNVLHEGRRLRSFLAVSDDGGVTWRERLPPYEASEVTHAQLVGCVGWALVGWRQEGPGDLTLLGTADCGDEWFTLSELPKSDDSGWPVALEFTDTFNGSITLAYQAPDLERGFLRTHDGGRSWTEAYGRRTEDEPPRIQRMFTAADGTQWKVDTDERHHVIRSRSSDKELWTAKAVLPAWLHADDGVLAPR